MKLKRNSPFYEDYLSYSKTERIFILVLVTTIFLVIAARLFIFPLIKNKPVDYSIFKNEVAAFQKQIDSTNASNKNKYKDNEFDYNNPDKSFAESKLNPFPFNPNTMTDDKWLDLGLTNYQIKVIKNYLAKGGKFYKKEDFKKMYSITDAEYDVLEPYITIPNKYDSINHTKTFDKIIKPLYTVSINKCDTFDLDEVKGIGPSYARRIFKYGERLGGYIKKEQLMEVFGLDSVKYNEIKASIIIDTTGLRRININKATIQDLKKHPYFDYYLAKSIVTYRLKNGDYKQVKDIKKAPLIYDDFYQKIAPYLIVE